MFLGAGKNQVPAILHAKRNYYVITVDYLPENPGHRIADEYHIVSTYDFDKIFQLAVNLRIDGISSYASDPSVLSAALVSERLGIVGAGYDSVLTLSNKEQFRNFLENEGFNTPWFVTGKTEDELLERYRNELAVIKPLDSSGSRGVFFISERADIKKYFSESVKYARCSTVILEQFIKRKGPQIHGDGFVVGGKLMFLSLGDQYFSPYNQLVPYSTLFPSVLQNDIIEEATLLIAKIIDKVGYSYGGINVEIIRDINDELYVVEIAPRNGGNYIPQLIKYATSFDLAASYVDGLMGEPARYDQTIAEYDYFFQVILHAGSEKKFFGIKYPGKFNGKVLESHIHLKPGDNTTFFNSSLDAIGVVLIGTNDQYMHSHVLNHFSKQFR